jgi:hypothetical protein
MPEPSDAHYDMVLKAITSGRVIPFLGAGVDLCDRPEGTMWAQHWTSMTESRFWSIPNRTEMWYNITRSGGFVPLS